MKNNFMKYAKKIAVLGLSVFLGLISFISCSIGTDNTVIIFTTGFGKDEVFRIGNEICKKNELMVYLTTVQNQYENVYGKEVWNMSLDGVTLEENVKETVLAKIARIKTMYLLAEEKGVTLEEEEESRVTKAAESYLSSLSEKEISILDVSIEVIRELYYEYAMAQKVYQQIIQDINPEISDDEARTITIQHILIRTVTTNENGEQVSLGEQEKYNVYQKACEIQEMAVSGEIDFEELITRYSEDTNTTYSFGKGEMEEEFENVAFELETGEVSEVVESNAGYHIIKCLSTFDRDETDANKIKIVEQRRKEIFGQEYDQFVATLPRKLNENLWEKISLIEDSEVTTSNFFDIYEKYFTD